jgi:type 1 glutamine amidotransferase
MIRLMPNMPVPFVLLALLVVTPWSRGAAADSGVVKRIVLMIGEDEYKTWDTLPAFADKELKPRGYNVRVVEQDPTDKHNFPGLVDALENADLLVVSVRRRSPPREQLAAVRRLLEEGKALIGIRTASHAFSVRGEDKDDLAKHPEREEWVEFDRDVLGGSYVGHHGVGPRAMIMKAPGVGEHPILEGMMTQWFSEASLYRAAPLAADARTLLIGSIPNQESQPVAWTRLYGPRQARVFYTSLGNESDFATAEFRRLLVNAVAWALE